MHRSGGQDGRWFIERLKQTPVSVGKVPKPPVRRKKPNGRSKLNRGWEGRDSRAVMLLEQERAGVKIAADPERVKQAAECAKSG